MNHISAHLLMSQAMRPRWMLVLVRREGRCSRVDNRLGAGEEWHRSLQRAGPAPSDVCGSVATALECLRGVSWVRGGGSWSEGGTVPAAPHVLLPCTRLT